ncbi:MFS transporter [Paludibacterium purpuratum]|uniref:MFS transporter n=1 Tax=Paludibacterium purpuratum TaxID=1144873 RepID=A0A4R7B2Z8_9NEIS|nr:MFS transporter [Paludibacterium purpuratum]TDR77911.1 MFS transporter [Paludibacterium purpuratum]
MVSFARRRRHFIGIATGLITGLDFLANATVNFAESSIRGGIGVSPADFLWVLSAYAVAGAGMILLLERLGRVMSYRTLLLSGTVLFTLGSIGAMYSQSLPALIAARLLQGLGGGPLLTCARILLQISVPAERRRQQLQGFMLGLFLCAAPGPWLAARLIESGDWHALFALHAAAGVLALIIGWAILPKRAHTTRAIGHIDGWAALAFCLGVLLWMDTLQGIRYDWLNASTINRLLLALGLFAGFGWRLHRHSDPWLKLGTLASRRYLTGLGFYTLYYLINGAVTLAVPMYLLAGEGMDLASAGALLTVGGLCTVLMLALYFRLAAHLPDRRYVIAAGFILLSALLLRLAADATGATPFATLLPIMAFKGLFPVLVVIQVAGLAFREFKQQDFMHAYAIKNVLRLLANTLGTGIANLYWQDVAAGARNTLIERFDPWYATFSMQGEASLAHWSQIVDQQAALIGAMHTFTVLAALSFAGALLVLGQKTLR